jgi:5'-nucleotidase
MGEGGFLLMTVTKKKKILISNDDGIHSEGIKALARAMKALGEVYVVAPDRERSASSHSLTLYHPLRVEEIRKNWYAVDGTPTDCVNLAINGILEERPDVVVAGINKGPNLGDDITYSGTVSVAMEGTLLGVPSVAVSITAKRDFHFKTAADFAKRLVRFVLKNGLPSDTLLNVNVPNVVPGEIKGYRITKQGKRVYGDAVVEKIDPRGRKYYWIGGGDLGFVHSKDSDFQAISEGYASVTPIHLNLTNHSALREIKKWKLPLK